MSDSIKIEFGVLSDMAAELEHALDELLGKEVMAGFPEDANEERADAEGEDEGITNAALGYIHNFGVPEQNIPARPFMIEGIEGKREPITDAMHDAGLAALDGDSQRVDMALHSAGLAAKTGIQLKILDGPFQPLADSTLKARARRGRQGAQEELDRRAAGEDPGVELARPLNDTGQMRNAVTYVVKDAD